MFFWLRASFCPMSADIANCARSDTDVPVGRVGRRKGATEGSDVDSGPKLARQRSPIWAKHIVHQAQLRKAGAQMGSVLAHLGSR